MTTEQAFFIQILSDHLNGRETQPRTDVDWSVLSEYARIHQVNGILYRQCASFLPAEMQDEFETRHATELFYYYNRIALFETVSTALTVRNIPFYTVKGLNVAQYYPVPALRTMGDCDIVVHSKDKDKAHEMMMQLGFRTHLKEDKDWMYFRDNMEFEIHDHLLYNESGNDRMSRDLTDTAWQHTTPTGKGTEYRLDWNFHFVFLLLHLKKHLVQSGIGFRQFMDLAVLIRHSEIDLDKIEQDMDRVGLLHFGKVCFSLLHRWFDVPEVYPDELSDAFVEEATQKIFGSGIFGHNEAKREEIIRMNRINEKHGPRWFVRVRNVISAVFPSYRSMRFAPAYAFLEGRPYLLPAAWVYRFYRAVRYRLTDKGRQVIEDAMISDEKLNERQEALRRWGL